MDQELVEVPKEVLVDIIKISRKLGWRGSSGGWKDFLNQDAGSGKNIHDPSKRSVDSLVAFLKTFSGKEEQEMRNVLRVYTVRRGLRESLDDDIPVQRLMRLTIDHPKYMQRYTFPSQNEQEWLNIPMGKVSEAMKNNVIIAIDCEMVLCEDGSDELVQVCAVDRNLKVKVNMLVKPKKAIVDYRTHITGLSSKDLDGKTCSLGVVQKRLKKLLFNGAILAGHGLYNDLKALKIYHPYVIDTSHIFKYENSEHVTPSLNNLCKSVLEYELRHEGKPHNCLKDAEAVMRLVLAQLHCPIDVLKDPTASDDHLKRLLLHNISIDVPCGELRGLFPGKYNVKFLGDLRRVKDAYSISVEFENPVDANNAFDEIRGHPGKVTDTNGRPQKRASMLLSSGRCTCFYVRGSFRNDESVGQVRPECKQLPDSKVVKGESVENEINSIVASMKRCSELDHVDAPVKRRHVDRKDRSTGRSRGL